ncbi:MAG: hypothetical protein E7458_02720 [Ruminococcaceae bacterium]|nr:hypothetical protein [Oscillospiraceae bacterium]
MSEQTKRIAKNAAILLLSVLLLVLTFITWFGKMLPGNAARREAMGEFFGGILGREDSAAELYVDYEAYEYTLRVLAPVRAAVRSGEGMCALSDRDQVRELFERSGSALTGAFESASEARSLSRQNWRRYLSGQHLFFDFEGELPLDILAAAFDADPQRFDGRTARYLVLAADEREVSLLWKTADGKLYSADTAVTSGEFAALLSEYGTGDAMFAFEQENLSHLPDEFIVVPHREAPAVYMPTSLVSENTSATGERMIQTVLTGFGFSPYLTGGYLESDYTRVYVEELSTLRIQADGKLSYLSPGKTEQPEIPDVERRLMLVNHAASLLDRVLSDVIGDGSLYLQEISCEEDTGRLTVTFGCSVEGIPMVQDDGYFARLEYEGEQLCAAYLTLQSFLRLQQTELLLPEEQAAAVTEGNCAVFELRYQENRQGEYHAGWYYVLEQPAA